MAKTNSKKIILLAEDEPHVAELYEQVLKLAGFEVWVVSNGKEAIAKLEAEKEKPVIILLDVRIPEVNGFEVLQYVKEKESLKDISVLMLTNVSEREEAEKALELGAVLYLVKGQYTPQEIVTKVTEIVEGYSRHVTIPKVKTLLKDLPNKKQ